MSELGEGNPEHLPPTEEMLRTSYELHEDFDILYWKKEKSFHNEGHIKPVAIAADRYISSIEDGTNDDPLELLKSIQQWNSEHPDSKITDFKQFKKIARMAFAAHDWGNIMQDIDFNERGEIVPVYHENGYVAKDAELRSQAMYEKYINNHANLSEDEKRIYINVGKELIWQTVGFPPAEELEKPFARFVRVCDQIGNDAFTENEDRVEGLLMEMINENPNQEVNPYAFVNFARWRLRSLLKPGDDLEDRVDQIYKMWGKDQPQELKVLKNQKMDIKDALNEVKGFNTVKKIVNQSGGLTAEVERRIQEMGLADFVDNKNEQNEVEPKPEVALEGLINNIDELDDSRIAEILDGIFSSNGNLPERFRLKGVLYSKRAVERPDGQFLRTYGFENKEVKNILLASKDEDDVYTLVVNKDGRTSSVSLKRINGVWKNLNAQKSYFKARRVYEEFNSEFDNLTTAFSSEVPDVSDEDFLHSIGLEPK